MSRNIKLNADRIRSGDGEIVVSLTQDELTTMALEITLLLCGLSELLWLASGKVQLTLRVANQPASMTTFVRDDVGRTRCVLSRDNAGALQMVALRAYRDGMAEVDHIHLEGELDQSPYDLTFRFDLAQSPMTPEEVEALIGR